MTQLTQNMSDDAIAPSEKGAAGGGDKRKNLTAAIKRWGVLLGVTALTLFIVLLPYIIRGNALVWFYDGPRQHTAFIEYMRENGIFAFGGYDYNISLGGDYMQSFSYYSLFDPVTLLLYVMPGVDILAAYSALVCVKFALCAIFMYVYMRSRKVKQVPSVIIAQAYMLSGYMLFTFTRHPDICAGAIYVPLVMLGLEKAIDKKPPFLLIASVFVMTISSFYTAYMVTLYAVIYAIFYYIRGQKTSGQKVTPKGFTLAFLRVAAYYLIGLALAAFMLAPVLNAFINGSRSGTKGLTAYTPTELVTFLGGFFIPYPAYKYTNVMFNFMTILLGCAAFAAAPKSPYGKLSVICAVGLFIPLFGYIMNFFNYASNRYSYLLSFSVYAMIGLAFGERDNGTFTTKEVNHAFKGFLLLVGILANLALWMVVELTSDSVPIGVTILFIVLVVIAAAATCFLIIKLFRHEFAFKKITDKLKVRTAYIILAVFSLVYAVAFNIPYSAEFDDGTLYRQLTSPAESYVASQADADGYVRLDSNFYPSINNRPINNGYRGTSHYNSMSPAAVRDFVTINDIYAHPDSLGIWGLNGRMALQALLCVKYYLEDGKGYIAPQFEASDNAEGLYETDDYVRFGAVFHEVMSEADFMELPEAERQYAALCCVATGGAKARPVDYTPILSKLVSVDDAVELTTTARETTVSFDLPQEACEVYVSFEISDFMSGSLGISSGGSTLWIESPPRGDQMYTGKKKFLIKLNGKSDKVAFVNANSHDVELKDIAVYAASAQAVLGRIRSAAALPSLTDTHFDKTGFGGNISSDGGTMLIQLPYSTGWTAYVDGEKTDINRADGALMCIDLAAGEHEIDLVYKTPWLTPGIAVTAGAGAATVVLAGVWIALYIRKKRSPRPTL